MTDHDNAENDPKRPTFRARLSNLLWPPGSPESQTAILDPSGFKAATTAPVIRPASEPFPNDSALDKEPEPLQPPAAATEQSGTYASYAHQHDATSALPDFDLRKDNERFTQAIADEQKARAATEAAERSAAAAPSGFGSAPEEAPHREPTTDRHGNGPELLHDVAVRSMRQIITEQVQEIEPRAAHEVTARQETTAPHTPNETRQGNPSDQTTHEGKPPSVRSDAQQSSGVRDSKVATADWAAEQIPFVVAQHYEHWRQVDAYATAIIDHMEAKVPNRSDSLDARLSTIASEVRHGFHQSRTALDLIQTPGPDTLEAFAAHAHQERTPALLKDAAHHEVPAIVIADCAALHADLHDTVDALRKAERDLWNEQVSVRPADPPELRPANGNLGAETPSFAIDDRPTFQHLTDARLDDINVILEEARSNDNRRDAPVALVLAAAAAQTFHRVSGLEKMHADTPERERAAEVTREDISTTINDAADSRLVHATQIAFSEIEAQDQAALAAIMALTSADNVPQTENDFEVQARLAAMMAMSSPDSSAQSEGASPIERLLAEDSAAVEMSDAAWQRVEVQDRLARMNEISDYKSEATEKNASRERNSGRDAGADR